jgi:excisionase family DNA binding protein
MEHVDIRLSVSEAAKFFGVSTRTIRRAIAENAVDYLIVQNRYKIDLSSLLNWASRTTTVRHKLEHDGFGQFVEQWKIPEHR